MLFSIAAIDLLSPILDRALSCFLMVSAVIFFLISLRCCTHSLQATENSSDPKGKATSLLVTVPWLLLLFIPSRLSICAKGATPFAPIGGAPFAPIGRSPFGISFAPIVVSDLRLLQPSSIGVPFAPIGIRISYLFESAKRFPALLINPFSDSDLRDFQTVFLAIKQSLEIVSAFGQAILVLLSALADRQQ